MGGEQCVAIAFARVQNLAEVGVIYVALPVMKLLLQHVPVHPCIGECSGREGGQG